RRRRGAPAWRRAVSDRGGWRGTLRLARRWPGAVLPREGQGCHGCAGRLAGRDRDAGAAREALPDLWLVESRRRLPRCRDGRRQPFRRDRGAIRGGTVVAPADELAGETPLRR